MWAVSATTALRLDEIAEWASGEGFSAGRRVSRITYAAGVVDGGGAGTKPHQTPRNDSRAICRIVEAIRAKPLER